MINLIAFLLLCYGTCNNLIFGSIFNGFRNFLSKFGTGDYSLYKLFTCFMCLGTWVGFLYSFILVKWFQNTSFTAPINTENIYITVFLNGLLASGGVWLIHTLQEKLER